MDLGHQKTKSVAIIVAHPDDETLWAGGTILSHPSWRCFIITLCRASDSDRAPKFVRALKELGAEGAMGDLNDGPEQVPLDQDQLQGVILQLLPQNHFDLILSHSPVGEYTRHRRHEEIGNAVITLWQEEKLFAKELWIFAYEDGDKQYPPQPIKTATIYHALPEDVWRKKYRIITETYGFPQDGFEAKTTPRAEAYWQFTNPIVSQQWLENNRFAHESSHSI